jgi:hypothetical protein
MVNNIPGVGVDKTYGVRVRALHLSGRKGNWGALQCMRLGNAGMIVQSESENESDVSIESRVSGISIYPNPTATGSFVLQYNEEGTGDEEMKGLVMLDITGKVVLKTNVVLNSNPIEIKFGDLASGVYVVVVGDERLRLIVE